MPWARKEIDTNLAVYGCQRRCSLWDRLNVRRRILWRVVDGDEGGRRLIGGIDGLQLDAIATGAQTDGFGLPAHVQGDPGVADGGEATGGAVALPGDAEDAVHAVREPVETDGRFIRGQRAVGDTGRANQLVRDFERWLSIEGN
jgi:hypothetical protein